MAEVIWRYQDFELLRREAEGEDKFPYEYAINYGGMTQVWTDNPQELGIYGRAYLAEVNAPVEISAEYTMFIKNERYLNHYGVKL